MPSECSSRARAGIAVWLLAGLLMSAAGSLAAEPQEPQPRRVRLRHERTVPLCVGRFQAPFCFSDTLFAASEGSGLWAWSQAAGGGAAAPVRIGTFGLVRQMVKVGEATCALDNEGVLQLAPAGDGGWSARRVLFQASMRHVTPADGNRFLVIAGESADLYKLDQKAGAAEFVCSFVGRDMCRSCVAELTRLAREKGQKPPEFHMLYAFLDGPFLVLEVSGCGVYAVLLSKDLTLEVIQKIETGHVVAAAPYRGAVLLATDRGLYLVPPPARPPEAGEVEEPGDKAAARRDKREPVLLAAGSVPWFKLCRDALVYQVGEKLLSLPLERLARVADHATGQKVDALEELEEAPSVGEPSVLAALPPKSRFTVSDDARTVSWIDDGAVIVASLPHEGGAGAVELSRREAARTHSVFAPDTPLAFDGIRVYINVADKLLGLDAASGKQLVPIEGGDAPPAFDANTLERVKGLMHEEGWTVHALSVGAESAAGLLRSQPAGEKSVPSYACRIVPLKNLAGDADKPLAGLRWDLSGNFQSSYPVVDGMRAFILNRDTYRPQAVCVGPGQKDLTNITFFGGAFDAAVADRLAFVARGLYGITVHDLSASDQFLYVGGVSAPDTTFYRVAVSGNRLAALTSQGISIYSWEASSPEPKTHRLPPARADKPLLTDDGVDVTSWDYANMRGYATPLELRLGPLPDWRQAAHGIVYANPATGEARFPPARMKPVKLRAVCELPHAFGTMACLGRDTLIVGGNEGMNLEWWDISDPTHPRFVERVEPSVGPPVQLDVRGNVVYLISNIWGGGLYVYDLSDQRKPVRLAGKVGLGERHASLCLDGNRAFVRLRLPAATIVTAELALPSAAGGGTASGEINVLGQTALPLQDAAALPVPALGGQRPDDADEVGELMQAGERGEAGEDELKPELKAETVIESDPRPMLLHKGHLLLASCWTGQRTGEPGCALFVLPVGEKLPEKPVCTMRLDVACRGMGIWKDRLYLLGMGLAPQASDQKGQGRRVTLDTYDVSDPSHPKQVHRWTREGPATSAGDFTMAGSRLWCCIDGKAHVFDLDGAQPALLATHDLSRYGSVYYAHDSRLFIQDTRTGVSIFDVTDPKSPRKVGRVLAADGWGGNIDVWRGVAYVGSEGGNIDNYQLQIVDVSNPLKPRLAELLAQFDWYCTPLAWGDYLWMSCNTHPTLLDISKEPISPPVITQVAEQPGGIIQGRGFRPFRDMVVSGFGGQVRLLKVAPGGKVETVSILPDVGGTATLACDRNHIYWGGQAKMPGSNLMANTVKVIDASDAKAPRVVSSLAFPGYHMSASLEHRDGYLFLWLERFGGWTHPGFWWGYGSHGWLVTIDVRDPQSPQVVSMYAAPTMIDSLGEMRLDGNMLYFASYMDNRLGIVDVSDPLHPVDVAAWRNWAPFYYVGDIDIDGEYGYLTTPYTLEVLDVPLSAQEPRGKLEWK